METENPKPSPRARLPRPVRERQMLEAAIISFGRHGFHGASMDQIAEDAGISKPMLYAYFDSKEGLYIACIRRAGLDLIDSVRKSFDSNIEAEQQLWNGFMAFLGYIKGHREAWNVVRNETLTGQPLFPDEMENIRVLLRQLVSELLAESALTSEVDREAFEKAVGSMSAALLGATEAVANWWVESGDDDPIEIPVSYLMSLFWLGARSLWKGDEWFPPVAPGSEQLQIAPQDGTDK